MKSIFIVLSEDGERSCDKEGDHESFSSREAAEWRAKELADIYPGEEIEIYQRVAVALASINKPLITEE